MFSKEREVMDLFRKEREFLQKLMDCGEKWKVTEALTQEQIEIGKRLEADNYIKCGPFKIDNLYRVGGVDNTISITGQGKSRLKELIDDVENENRERLEQSVPYRAKRWGWEALRWGITVVSAVFLTQWAQDLWDEPSNSDADAVQAEPRALDRSVKSHDSGKDEVRIELRAPELVWDRDCWAVAGDVVATGKTAPVMHVTLSYDWKGRKNGQEGWIGVTVRDGVGKLKARLPHHTDKEAAPRLQFALHSWQPAYGGAFEVIGGE